MTSRHIPFWNFVALTSYPNGEIRRGQVQAYSLNGALNKIQKKGFFAISLQLANLQNGKIVQNLAITQAVINRLRREGVETKLIAVGKLVVAPLAKNTS
ncbi:MAG: hypothetical protein WC610_03250 [Patescibacteria group bacterium]